MNQVTQIANYEPVEIVTPFIQSDKAQILAYGLSRNLNYSATWTCYNGRHLACGKCGACTERLEAFSINGAQDPIPYER